jgi:hypothetical protein
MNYQFRDIKGGKYELMIENEDNILTVKNVIEQLKEKYSTLQKEYSKEQLIYNGVIFSGEKLFSDIKYLSGKEIVLFLVAKIKQPTSQPIEESSVSAPASATATTMTPSSTPPPPTTQEPLFTNDETSTNETSFIDNPLLKQLFLHMIETIPFFSQLKEKFPETYEAMINDHDMLVIIEAMVKPSLIEHLQESMGGSAPALMRSTETVGLTDADMTNVESMMAVVGCDKNTAIRYYINAGKNTELAINLYMEDSV